MLSLDRDRNGDMSSLEPLKNSRGRGLLRKVEKGGRWVAVAAAGTNRGDREELGRRCMAEAFAKRLLTLGIRVGKHSGEGQVVYYIWEALS